MSNSRRLLLGELDLGARAGQTRVIVALPTPGRGLAQKAALYDRDGVLLDRTQRSKLMEFRVRMKVSASGDEPSTRAFDVGETVVTTLDERLTRLDQVEQDYRDFFEAGLKGRIVRGRRTAFTVIGDHVAGARGELCIMDPCFGADPRDWRVLKGITIPVRVLPGKSATRPPTGLGYVKVRQWAGAKKNPLFHDRFYLWDGGGLTVGASPSGFGNRDARIDRIRGTESEGWQAQFGSYWTSSDFQSL